MVLRTLCQRLKCSRLDSRATLPSTSSVCDCQSVRLLAHDAFVRTNRRAISMMFVCLSVCLSGRGVHCDHTMHFSVVLSLWLDSPMFWAPRRQSMSTYSQPVFQFHQEKRWGMDVQTRRDISKTVEDRG